MSDTINFIGKYLSYFKIPINNRHDIIHRNGKNHDGAILHLTKKDIKELASMTKKFVSFLKEEIDKKINDPDAKKVDESLIDNDSPF